MQRIGIILLECVTRLLSLLPLRAHHILSLPFCWLAKDILKYRKDVVVGNLKAAFPDKSSEEIKEITKGFYRHFSRILVEAIWFGGSGNERLHRQHISEIVNPKVLNDAYDNSPSVMLLATHLGNWELCCGMFAFNYDEKNPFHFGPDALEVVYKKLTSELWEDFFKRNRIHCIRKQVDDCFIKSTNILRYAIEHRNDKKVYVFATDQYPYIGTVKMKVNDFMHQETYSMSGGASLAHKFGMSVVYMGCRYSSKGQYMVHYEEICRDASTMSPEEIMNEYYRHLQRDIEESPSIYLWSHKRWKNLR